MQKNDAVLIANKKYRHFVGGSYPNHYIPFPEDGPYDAKKRKKLEELNDKVNSKNINLAAETNTATVSY